MGPRRRDETTGGTGGGGGGSGGANSGRIGSQVEDDHNNRNAARHQDVDDEPEHIVVDDDGTAEADRDIWAAAEGYTPLAGITGNDADDADFHPVMVSMGPSNNDSDEDGNDMREENMRNEDEGENDDGPGRGSTWHRQGGAFFVNPSAFIVSEPDNNDNDDDEGKEEKDGELDPGPSLPGYDTIPTVDFEDVAARALRALDDEYIGGAAIGTSHNTSEPSTSATDATNSLSSPENDQQITDPEDRRDNEIIAAAFDRRKEELDRIKEQEGFVVDWNVDTDLKQRMQQQKQQQQISAAALPPVDTDAVRRAVNALSSKSDAPFQQKFAAWQEKQKKKTKKDSSPPDHAIIPAVSCKAFYKSTPKAKEATGHLTRSATIAEAMVRLQLTTQPKPSSSSTTSSLVVDVIGVDHVECASSEKILRTFQPLVRWLGTPSSDDENALLYDEIHFRLSGRDLMTNITTVDLLTNIGSSVSSRIKKASARCYTGTYHEIVENAGEDNDDFMKTPAPQIVIAFNAGIWGYSEWEETIRYLADRQVVSNFIITAYTIDECQEDFEVIERAASPVEGTTSTGCRSKILWKPENNPFGSKIIRETKSSASEYRENAAWQAWRLGGCTETEE
mmetsp:Transcript_35328/g.85502  ORF Transcript_35328/g.85502 Transcript_35328/m.85502 type:complete len:620 (-) Transcript_35328:67-1926(-)